MKILYQKNAPFLKIAQKTFSLQKGKEKHVGANTNKRTTTKTTGGKTKEHQFFRSSLMTMLLTIHFFALPNLKTSSKALAQTVTNCPDGTAPRVLDWDNADYPVASLNETYNVGEIQTTFLFTENPPNFTRDVSPPRPLGTIPLGRDNGPYGGVNQRFLRWGIDAEKAPLGTTTLTITFSRPVTLPSRLQFFDVDKDRPDEAPYQDQIRVTGFNTDRPVDVTLTPVNPSFVGVSGNQARGIQSNAPPTSNNGNVQAAFSGPVTQIVVVYNSGLGATPPGQDQTIGIGDISICPTPVLAQGTPNLRLVKRITNVLRNNQPVRGLNFNSFIDDPNDQDDNTLTRSQIQPLGLTQIESPLQNGDVVEYTVYFLNDGADSATNIKFCDLIPSGKTYSPDSFGTNRGILVNQAGQINPLSNTGNADQGFYRPLQTLPSGNSCSNQNNPNGAVVVNLGNISNTAGRNYGFVRFRTTVN